MAVEFGQENSRLEVSEEAGICGSRSTSVCVLLGWLHFGHLSAPLLARKSVKLFSTYECGVSGEYLPATCRPRPMDLHPFYTLSHTHTLLDHSDIVLKLYSQAVTENNTNAASVPKHMIL